MPDPKPIPMLERRRIEAAILKHVYDTLKASHGVEVAQKTIADAVRNSSIEQAKEFAAKVGGKTSMQTFIDRQALWKAGGGMEMEVKEQTTTSYVFNVTRCRYAEMYREMGLAEIGHLLSCQRDATFCEGYDKRLRLTRKQTIMQGASHCDFDYKLLDDTQQS
jgi:L-2-amino-thiazoline-4-carboxylic acid hydrolase